MATEVPPKEERKWMTLDEVRELEMRRPFLHSPLQALKDAKEQTPKPKNKKKHAD